jgi:hypothetical protein
MVGVTQFWSGIAAVIVSLGIGMYFQNRRTDDLRSEMNARFGSIDKRFDDLKDWLRSEFKRLDERMEHPLIKK